MSNKNTLDGLRFRIMETLEKQPNRAPLTASEIASRLHTTDYPDVLFDNLNFKVATAVHAMKDKGQIIVCDARDKTGKLTYQLPVRMAFPTRNDTPPANPVLRPEIAEKIVTVQPKPEPEDDARPVYAVGVGDAIIDVLNKAEHPLTSIDVTERLKHLYKAAPFDEKKLKMTFAGHINGLFKHKRLNRRRVHGYGTKVHYEYYTKRTGKSPHPLSMRHMKPDASANVPMPDNRPPIAQATPRPKTVPIPAPPETQIEATAVAAYNESQRSALFRPVKHEAKTAEIILRVPVDKHAQIVNMAAQYELTISEFCMQAIDFALSHTED